MKEYFKHIHKTVVVTVFLWMGLIGIGILLYINQPVWKMGLLITMQLITAVLNTNSITRLYKKFFLNGDLLTIHQAFRKEKGYHLQTIQSWEDYSVTTFGVTRNSRTIKIMLENGKDLYLTDKYNQAEFEKVLNYLNETKSEMVID